MNLESTFEGKKVLVTGNTGFKGSWLTIWLLSLGGKDKQGKYYHNIFGNQTKPVHS